MPKLHLEPTGEIRLAKKKSKSDRYRLPINLLFLSLSITFGFLLSYSYYDYSFWYFVFPSLIWLALLLDQKKQGLLAFFIFFFFISFYIGGLYLNHQTITFTESNSLFFVYTVFVFLSTVLSIISSAIFLIYKLILKNTGIFGYIEQPVINKIITFAAIIATYQLINAEILSFPLLSFGNLVVGGPYYINNWLPIIGTTGASILIAIVSSSIYHLFKGLLKPLNNGAKLFIPALTICLIIAISYALTYVPNWSHKNNKSIKIALIHPDKIEDNNKKNISNNIEWLHKVSEETNQNIDILISPESILVKDLYNNKAIDLSVLEILQPNYLITSSQREAGNSNKIHSSIFLLNNSEKKDLYIYDKQKLIPFVEYIPLADYLYYFIRKINVIKTDLSQGPKSNPFLLVNDFTLKTSIGYESAFANNMAYQSNNSDAFLTINNSFFNSNSLLDQHLQVARARAIENGRYLIYASNKGVSAIIDNNGNIVKSTDLNNDPLISNIPGYSGKTPFSIIGYWINPATIIISILLSWLFRFRGRSKINL